MPELPKTTASTPRARFATSAIFGALLTLASLAAAPAWGLETTAFKDRTCAGYRAGSALNCTAGEFTIGASFSAANGTAPFCMVGQEFKFKVDLRLYGSNANRYDIGFFAGQQGNDPGATTAGDICSVATFPKTPSPWLDLDSDACGDYLSGGDTTITVNEIKVVCAGDSTGALMVPYVVTYWQNSGNVCTGPDDVKAGSTSKCNKGISTVSGSVKVYSGYYVDITKQTLPDQDPQKFTYTATGPAGSKVVASVVVSPTQTVYQPATIDAAGTIVTTSAATETAIGDGQTVRFFVNATDGTDRQLVIEEAQTPDWESGATISCPGYETLVVNNDGANRKLIIKLNQANPSAACTFTNTKRSRMTLQKSLSGRIDALDQFTVSASGGGTLSGTTSVATSGNGTTATTTFHSTPNTLLTLTESRSSGTTPLGRYETTLACTNAYSGPGATPYNQTIIPVSVDTALGTISGQFTPAPGDDLTCVFANTAWPAITKAFGAGVIAQGQPTSLTFTISNILGAPAQSGLAFTDTLPPEITVSSAASSQCGGTVTFTANSISLAGGSLAAGVTTCTVTATVTSTALGTWSNGSGNMAVTHLYNGVTPQNLQVVIDATLTILKTADNPKPKPGEIITYTLLVTNTGYFAASNISVTDVLSPYTAFGTGSYPSSPTPYGPAFEISGSGSIPTPGTPQYYDKTNTGIVPAPPYDGSVAKWIIPFSGSLGGSGDNITIKYKVQVK